MCAINGCNFEDREAVLRMNAATAHRGPDGEGVFISPEMSFGHRRLKIIDLSENARQPMESANGRFIIVFNGEIYNYRELRRELQSGYRFKSSSDTEVILAAYEKWGNDCLLRLSGMFSFAIWDKTEKSLFAARDSLGVKPLYYFWDGARFIFSSEIKAILEHDVSRELDLEAMNLYFSLLYVPSPLTLFKHIKKLPPAHFLVLKGTHLSLTKYWEGSAAPNTESPTENAEAVRESLIESANRQLVSDRPVGVYLSGGLDSNSVLAALKARGITPETFSLGFELDSESQEEKFNADFHLARRSSEFFGTKHHEIILKKDGVLDLFKRYVYHCDEPIAVPTGLSMLHLGEFAKEKVAVALGGNGGDELFGGYERYRLSLAASLYQKFVPKFIRNNLSFAKLQKLNTPEGIDRFLLFMEHDQKDIRSTLPPSVYRKDTVRNFFAPKFSGRNQNTPFELAFMDVDRETWIPDESLTLADKMSMASGLELRVPVLDREVVETALAVPLYQKVSLFEKKKVLKKAFENDLPAFLFDEPKRGWFSPGSFWLRLSAMKEFARDILTAEYYSETKRLFNWNEVERIREEHLEHKKYHLNFLWALLAFQYWAKEFEVKVPEK